MKIIYFTRDYTTHDHRFLSALAKSEHKVYYLRLERRGHQLEDRPLPPEVEIVHWKGGQRPAKWSDGLRLLPDLKRVIRTIKPDLIHAGPLQSSALLAALSGFKPLVSMSWGYDLLIDARRNALWKWATQHTLKHSSAMVGDCDTIRRLGLEFGMPGERIVTFPWGVDLQHFIPGDRPYDTPEVFTLLSTRNWEPVYGVDIIAKAFARAAKQLSQEQGLELRLIMLGNGSQAGALRQEFMQAGVLERVHFPGQVGYNDLPRFYRAADLYVSASHSDGSSISLLEAMACGTPALVSDIPGNCEWITPGEQGWLFAEGDPHDLCRAILVAVENRSRLPDMGRLARLLTEQRADWAKNSRRIFDAYEIAINSE